MKCPNCNTVLVMSERQGVEIDYCPNCRGVWLDKGELDKIIEKSAANEARHSPPAERDEYKERDEYRHKQEYYDKDHPEYIRSIKEEKRGVFWVIFLTLIDGKGQKNFVYKKANPLSLPSLKTPL